MAADTLSDDDPIARIGLRIWARVVDGLLLGVPLMAFVFLASDVDVDERVFDTPVWVRAVTFVLGLSYETFLVAGFGQTIGKKVARIRVVNEDSGEVPSLRDSAQRAVPIAVLSFVPLVGGYVPWVFYLPALWRQRHRGLHDSLAHTVVVTAHHGSS